MINYWMFIINQENWEIVKKTNIIGSKYIYKIKPIKVGDIILIYLIKKIYAFIGTFNVLDNFYDESDIFHKGIYPYRLKLDPIAILKVPIKIKPLIERLTFIKNKKKWGSHFFGVNGVRQLSKTDFDTINEVIEMNEKKK